MSGLAKTHIRHTALGGRIVLAKSGIKGCAIGRLDAEDIIRALEAAPTLTSDK